DPETTRCVYWLQPDLGIEQLECALLQRGKLWIEHKGYFWAIGHNHRVSGDSCQVSEKRSEAMDGQAVVGALGCGLHVRRFGTFGLGDDRGAGSERCSLVMVFENDRPEVLAQVPFEVVSEHAQQHMSQHAS